jgi:hypothetical protein
MPLVGSAVLAALAENWWLLLRGVVSIAFGLIAFFWSRYFAGISSSMAELCRCLSSSWSTASWFFPVRRGTL